MKYPKGEIITNWVFFLSVLYYLIIRYLKNRTEILLAITWEKKSIKMWHTDAFFKVLINHNQSNNYQTKLNHKTFSSIRFIIFINFNRIFSIFATFQFCADFSFSDISVSETYEFKVNFSFSNIFVLAKF